MSAPNTSKSLNSKANPTQISRIIKFTIVGLSGVIINEGLLWLLTDILGVYYLISSIVAIETSIINNFLINSFWTWGDRIHKDKFHFFIRMFKYHIVTGMAALVGNVFILWFLTTHFNLHYLVSNLFGIIVGGVLNYLANHFWTFAAREEHIS